MEGCWFLLVSLSGSYLAGIEANFVLQWVLVSPFWRGDDHDKHDKVYNIV